jgi:CHASE2 domain-containing sensor protein
MRIVERVERNGPDKPHRSPPPFKLAISAGILIVGLIVAGLLAPTSGLMWASFALAWGALLWLMMIGGAFAREARRNNGGGKN